MRLIPLLLISVSALHGQIINAATCGSSDVQTALNLVVNTTTTVNIPSGTCTWSSAVSLSVPSGSTSLTIAGAGSSSTLGGGDVTVITDNIAGSTPPFAVTTTTGGFFRIYGITFQDGTGGEKDGGFISVGGASVSIRIDHSHFNTTTGGGAISTGISFIGCVSGVADHNIFDNSINSVANSIRNDNAGTCYSDAVGVGDQSWAHSTALGTSNFTFVETNTFNGGAGNDCTFGGRFVWRFNTMNMTQPAPSVQTHPTGGAKRIRGCRAWEIYQNTFTAQSANYINTVFWPSAGTGVFWGNTIPSSSAGGGTGYKNVLQVHSMRTDNSTYPQDATPNGWGYCGTNFNGTGSNWDQNTSAATGYHCFDQPGMGQGDLLIGGFTSDGSGSNNVQNNATGCFSNSSCAWARQAIEPMYEWMDTYSHVPSNPSTLVALPSAVVNNADIYYACGTDNSSCASFTGAFGTGFGVFASLPATCTTGVAYWATDQGSWNTSGGGGQGVLYTCVSTNTWSLTYTPYAYPNPLTSNIVATGTISGGLLVKGGLTQSE